MIAHQHKWQTGVINSSFKADYHVRFCNKENGRCLDDDDNDDLSGFLMGLDTSHGSWSQTFITDHIVPNLHLLVTIYDKLENAVVLIHYPKRQGVR